MKRLKQWPNFWIVLVLLLANGLAWFQVSAQFDWPEAEPVLHPEIAEIRAHWQARDAVGEPFSVVVTDQMAMETIAWFMALRTNLPMSRPYVEIHPDGVIGGSVLHLMGLQTAVLGQATVWVENGKVTGRINSVQVAGRTAPPFVADAVSQAKSIYDDLSFPIEITHMELREGEVLIEGAYR
ncbi:MAG: hypothetical protein GY803_27865 [Chloroflexi bacterium]|nr:hypothetical protein [Chloroflexota bacterium]